MKFTFLSNLILETFKSAYGTNKFIYTTDFCNIYEAYPHFEDRFNERYLGYSNKERYTKMARATRCII